MSDNLLIGLVLILAGVLRIYNASHELWLDEALSYHFVTTRPVSDLLFSLPLIDPHPPLYYIVLEGWTRIAGTSEIALRTPSIVFGTLSVGAFYYLVNAVFDRPTALLSALLMAISPFFITYSQEARMYALAVLLTITATYFLYRAANAPSPSRYLGYVVSAVLLGYTHVWGLLVLGSHVLYTASVSVTEFSKDEVFSWIVTFVSVGTLLSPWLGVLLWRAFFRTSGALGWLSPPSIRRILTTPVMWVTGVGLHYSLVLTVPVAVFLVSLWAVSAVGSIDPRYGRWLSDAPVFGYVFEHVAEPSDPTGAVFAFLLLVPLVIGIALSYLVQPMYHIRATVIVAIGFYALLARGMTLSKRVRSGSYVSLICVFLVVGGLVFPLPAYYDETSKEPWANSIDRIQHAADENDLVLITDRYMQSVYAFYAVNTSPTVLTIPEDPRRDLGVHPVYDSISPESVQNVSSKYDRIFLVSSHVSREHVVDIENELNNTHEPAERYRFSSLDLLVYEATTTGKSTYPNDPGGSTNSSL